MNCKPGDVAVVFKAFAQNECSQARIGIIVRVTELANGWGIDANGRPMVVDSWLYEGPVRRCRACGAPYQVIADETLKPLPPEKDVEQFDRDVGLEVTRRDLERLRDILAPHLD